MIKQFSDDNYKNIIALETLEQQFHYSRYHLSRAFVDFTGTSIIKYYHEQRFAYAKEMLREGAAVTHVANELNFNSIYSYIRFYKNAAGCSPTAYRATCDPTIASE